MAKPPRREPTAPAEPDDQSAAAIERQIAELQAMLARKQAGAVASNASPQAKKATTRVNTAGGAVVQGSVTLSNGHFIGRDSIRIINQVVKTDEDAKNAQLALASYLHALVTELAGLRLGDIDASTDQTRQTPLQLPDIYVPLNTTYRFPESKSLDEALASKLPDALMMSALGRGMKVRSATALETLATCPQLTLLGAPGSGKSTFGAHVLLILAQAWQTQHKQTTALGKRWPHGALLPVRVVLRRFAELHAASTRKLTAGDLWQFIGQDLHEGGWGVAEQAMVFVQCLAREHGALVLFDGLDECGDAARRERVMVAVQAFMLSEARLSRFVLTARPYAFAAGADPSHGVFELAEFDDEQIKQFITGWYAALAHRGWRTEPVAVARRDELIAAYPRKDLLPLAHNPLLLTLMATLHSNRGRLPDDRVQLYEETVDLLLQRWNKDVGADRALLDALAIPGLTLNHLRSVLEALAFKVHEANAGESGVAEIGEDQLVRAFRPLLDKKKDKADQVVEFIERRAGLLLGHGERDGERRFTFPHRTFQEFLAACHLSTRENFAQECRRLVDTNTGHWRVVLPLAARLAKAERGATAADELIGGTPVDEAARKAALTPAHWDRALIAALQLQEIGISQLGLSDRCLAVLGRVRGWLAAGLPLHPQQGGARAAKRAQAGDALAALGDPRFDAGRFHLPADDDLGFVQIFPDPAFFIGKRAADKAPVDGALDAANPSREANEEPAAAGEFWMARYPVTVAQFADYVQATGAHPGDTDALRDSATRPVRWVSWHEALQYCDWLNQQLVQAPALTGSRIAQHFRQHKLKVGLPSGLEWEMACRGGLRDQVFSWGDAPDPESANWSDSSVSTTSAVGCFAPNAFGLYDMLGNLFEWTSSEWTRHAKGDYSRGPENPKLEDLRTADKVDRVVRGGSFDDTSRNPGCAYRRRDSPDYRSRVVGFRVVLRSASVSKI